MHATRLEGSDRAATWLLAFRAGDDVLGTLRDFAQANDVAAGSFQAIGAFRRATVAFYDLAARRYEEHAVDEQVEVCSLVGNVSRFQGAVRIHAHVVLGHRDLGTLGGHLVDAVVDPTLELFLRTFDAALERAPDAASGLPLL